MGKTMSENYPDDARQHSNDPRSPFSEERGYPMSFEGDFNEHFHLSMDDGIGSIELNGKVFYSVTAGCADVEIINVIIWEFPEMGEDYLKALDEEGKSYLINKADKAAQDYIAAYEVDV